MRTHWPHIALLYGAGLAGSWQLGKIPPLLPAIQADLALGPTGQGLVASAVTFLAIGLCGQAARLTAHVTPAAGFTLALGVTALGALGAALAPTAFVLIAARFAEGLGYVYLIVAAPTAMAAVAKTDRDRAVALSLWGTFVPVGLGLGGLLAGWTAGPQDGDWRQALTLAAAPPALLAVSCALLLRGLAPTDAGPAIDPGVPAPARQAGGVGWPGLLLALAFGLFAGAFLALLAFLPTRWAELGGLGRGGASIAFALVSAASIPGSLFTAWRLARGGDPPRLALIGIALQSLAGAVAILVPNAGVSALAAGLAVALGGLTPAAAFAMAPLLAPSPKVLARINGWIAAMGSAGSFIAPPLMGQALALGGWPAGAAFLIALGLAGCLAITAMPRRAPSV